LKGAVLRWDIFDGTQRTYERKKAAEKAAEVSEHLAGLKQLVSFRIEEAYLAVREAHKNEELAESALRTAEEGARLVKVRYENALSPMVDLLDAQLNLDHTRATRVMRQNEYRTAVLNLGFQGGTILKDLGIDY
jgi:outer membrane protein TolC